MTPRKQAPLTAFFGKRPAAAAKKRPASTSEQHPENKAQRPGKRLAAARPVGMSTQAEKHEEEEERIAPARGDDWFSQLFGFAETEYSEAKSWLRVVQDDQDSAQFLESLVTGARYSIGRFERPSLGELRARVAEVVADAADVEPGQLRVRNEIGDVAAKHALAENRWATFQVASQFNCLEFVGPSVTPEDGITGYIRDRTQGPACSISCGPATAYRNYFAPVMSSGPKPKLWQGQLADRQVDNLEEFSNQVENEPAGRYFDVQGGYTLATSKQLSALNAHLRRLSEDARDKLRDTLRIGVHADVQVTSFGWGSKRVKDPKQCVTQVFGSACSVAYNRRSSQQDWEVLASIVLEASYEATLLAAFLQSVEHGGKYGSRKVFLTCLGGGVFGNSMSWIVNAMRRAFHRLKDLNLDVRIITYSGTPDRSLLELEREFR